MDHITNIPKPTMFGCYEKTEMTTVGRNYTVRHMSNQQHGLPPHPPGTLGVTKIDIQTRMPVADFIDNKGPDITCVVVEGQGFIHYCFENVASHKFALTSGDTVLIPKGAVYAIEGPVKVVFLTTPQWIYEKQTTVTID